MLRRWCAWLLAAIVWVGGSPEVFAVGWQAGAARVNITPQRPMWMSGYVARTTPARGTLHELWAKALVLEDAAGRRAVLVTMDLVGIDRNLSLGVRKRIEEKYQIPRASIVLASSHTHSGPVVGDNLAPMFDLDDRQQALVARYAEELADNLVAVVGSAIEDLAPAELSRSMGAAMFAVNRRNNPEAEVPQRRKENRLVGPVDHDVPVLAVRCADGKLRAVVSGYACHATVLNDDRWSGDWPGAAQLEIERRHPDAIALYWCGCGADQNPLPRRTVELVNEFGEQFADAVDLALMAPSKMIAAELETAYEEVDLPFDTLPTRAELTTRAAGTTVDARRAKRVLDAWDRDGKLSQTYPYPVQRWRLGDDLSWFFLGGEVVVDYAIEIKQRIGAEQTWVASYSNDVMGYIPSRRVLGEGGYEGRDSGQYYGVPTTWSPEVERVIVERVERMAETSSVAPADLRCEYLIDPLAVESSKPRLSWRLAATSTAPAHSLRQTAWQIRAASTRADLEGSNADLWDSGRVESNASQQIEYGGRAPASGGECYWQVRTWDQDGEPSQWSPAAMWRAGLRDADDWQGPWIGAPSDGAVETANQYYRKAIQLDDAAPSGVVYVASLGYHDLYVNGERVGDAVLAPAISDPMQRVRYVAYDVTPHLRRGDNIVAIAVGAGWTLYDGQGWPQATRDRWPKRPALRMQARFASAAGEPLAELHSDATWRTHPAEIQPIARWQFRDFNGERIVEALRQADWETLDFDDSTWTPAEVRDNVHVKLTPQNVEPNRVLESVHAATVVQREPGVFRVSLERMFNGLLDVKLAGRPGAKVTVEVSDRPETDGVYNQRHEFTIGADGRGAFRNRFNYTTGEWLTIRGDVGPPKPNDICGLLVSTDMGAGATFSCDDEQLRRLHKTAVHTLRCLTLGGYVVDCSHRERLGYGGDGQGAMQVMLPNFQSQAMLGKWLEDWADVQQSDGNLPFTAPTYGGGGGPAWSGFVVHATAEMYDRYGDVALVERMYPTISRWLAFLETRVKDDQLQRYDGPPDYIAREWSFLGDWVAPGHQQGPNGDAPETHFLNNCYYVWTLRRAGMLAVAIGHADEGVQFARRASQIAAATHAKYWKGDEQTYADGRQASLSIALVADVPPPNLRPVVAKRLQEQILVAKRGHLDTGIGGTQYLLRALQTLDRPDLVFAMASQRDYPGWGDMLRQGATAFWEQWDGGNSRCHASFIGIGGWSIESLVGIQHDPAAPGLQHMLLKPSFVEDVERAGAKVPSPYGEIASTWRRAGGRLELEFTIPPNTAATAYMPEAKSSKFRVNGLAPTDAAGVTAVRSEGGRRVFDVESGKYAIVREP